VGGAGYVSRVVLRSSPVTNARILLPAGASPNKEKNITENEDGFQYGRRFYWHHSCRPSRRPSPHPAVKTHHEILHIEIEKQKKYQNYFREISNQTIKVFKKKISR
jgi:hypothetical protein